MRLDRYLHTHWQFYVRELRIKAYNQFLESYRTVHLDTMSVAFNISLELLDRSAIAYSVAPPPPHVVFPCGEETPHS